MSGVLSRFFLYFGSLFSCLFFSLAAAMPNFSFASPIAIVLPALGYLLTVYFVMMWMSSRTSDF